MERGMAKIMGVAAVMLVVILAFAYVHGGTDPDGESSAISKTSDDEAGSVIMDIGNVNGTEERSIQIKVGEKIELSLRSNPTTGYGWVVMDHDSSISVDSKYATDAHEPEMVGVGGTETFSIVCSQSGDYTLELEYKRSWESVDPIGKVILHIACSS